MADPNLARVATAQRITYWGEEPIASIERTDPGVAFRVNDSELLIRGHLLTDVPVTEFGRSAREIAIESDESVGAAAQLAIARLVQSNGSDLAASDVKEALSAATSHGLETTAVDVWLPNSPALRFDPDTWRRFWYELLLLAAPRLSIFRTRRPTKYSALRAQVGITRWYSFYLHRDGAALELSLLSDAGPTGWVDQFSKVRAKLERDYHGELYWHRRATSMAVYERISANPEDESVWPDLQNRMVEAMARFYAAMEGALPELLERGVKSATSFPPTTPPADLPRRTTEAGRPWRHIRLADLIQTGYLKPPVEIEAAYKGNRFVARINEGATVTWNGASYASLSTAGGMARGSVIGAKSGRAYPQTDGWTFWRVRDETGRLVPIDSLRQRAYSSKPRDHVAPGTRE